MTTSPLLTALCEYQNVKRADLSKDPWFLLVLQQGVLVLLIAALYGQCYCLPFMNRYMICGSWSI